MLSELLTLSVLTKSEIVLWQKWKEPIVELDVLATDLSLPYFYVFIAGIFVHCLNDSRESIQVTLQIMQMHNH